MHTILSNFVFNSQRITRTFSARFWKYVIPSLEPNGCWIWKGCLDGHGYGQFAYGRQFAGRTNAHRASWIIHKGQIPEGMDVLHRCDNPSCVRPSHLFLGTAKDNAADMHSKRRANTFKKVPDKTVKEMRERYSLEKVSQPELAKQYGLTTSHVWRILNGRSRRTIIE